MALFAASVSKDVITFEGMLDRFERQKHTITEAIVAPYRRLIHKCVLLTTDLEWETDDKDGQRMVIKLLRIMFAQAVMERFEAIALLLAERHPIVVSQRKIGGIDVYRVIIDMLSPKCSQRIMEIATGKLYGYSPTGLMLTERMYVSRSNHFCPTLAFAGVTGYIPLIRTCLQKKEGGSFANALIGACWERKKDAIIWLNVQQGNQSVLRTALSTFECKTYIKETLLKIGCNLRRGTRKTNSEKYIAEPLVQACLLGNISKVMTLYEKTSNSMYKGHHFIHYAVNSRSLNMVRWVIETFGKDCVNLKDKNGWSPLHYACLLGEQCIIRFLLFNEAYRCQETSSGHAPLDVLPYRYKHFGRVSLLLSKQIV